MKFFGKKHLINIPARKEMLRDTVTARMPENPFDAAVMVFCGMWFFFSHRQYRWKTVATIGGGSAATYLIKHFLIN